MAILEANIAIGMGDIIMSAGQIEPFKNRFERINITFDPTIIKQYRNNDPKYIAFLDEIGALFFGEAPYKLNQGNFRHKNQFQLAHDYGLPLIKPDLKHLLCRGQVLNLNQEYIVLTTKLRLFPRAEWQKLAPQFWKVMNQLATKYKIVVLGEKAVEMSPEYKVHGAHNIYGIYPEILSNLPKQSILDLTIPALGITAPNLKQIQQDAMLMNQAKCVIMLSTGGAFCLSLASARMTLGYRMDRDDIADILFNNREYPDAFITKDWLRFISKLEEYTK